VLQCVAVSCRVLQCVTNTIEAFDGARADCRCVAEGVAVCCSVLQCVAVCCSVLQWLINANEAFDSTHANCKCVAEGVAVRCSQCFAVCCSVAVSCSELQCVIYTD